MAQDGHIPKSVLIVGSGVFGLSTAYALAGRPEFADSKITVLDRSTFPSPDGSSIDSSRIVRADYADISYAALCLEAQDKWRNSWWGENAYHEDGLVIAIKNAADEAGLADGEDHEHGVANLTGCEYMRRSLANVKRLGMHEGPGSDVEVLCSMADVTAQFRRADNVTPAMTFDADMGYINRRSGWVDATAAMVNLRRAAEATGRIDFVKGQAKRLLYRPSNGGSHAVAGVELTTGATLTADLTVLAAGAWTPSLVDLRGIASATGQVLGYIALTASEAATLAQNPTILNESTGLFIITPSAGHLKVARHGYGYANPTTIQDPSPTAAEGDKILVSLPRTSWEDGEKHAIPAEGQACLRAFLRTTFPTLAQREWAFTRLCWYTDTPHGDWLVSHHPQHEGLFVATGGSGHAFKFAPVVGECVVDRILRREVKHGLGPKWDWPARREESQVWTEDWRGGRKGMVLAEEYAKDTVKA